MSDMTKIEELQKHAQEKLSEARRLIREAGELAKEGQFPLHFGEIGDFVPRSFVDSSLLRDQAIASLMRDGRYNEPRRVSDPTAPGGLRYEEVPTTPWEELNEDERELAIDEEIESIRDGMDVPWEFRDYCGIEDADQWWHPSRC